MSKEAFEKARNIATGGAIMAIATFLLFTQDDDGQSLEQTFRQQAAVTPETAPALTVRTNGEEQLYTGEKEIRPALDAMRERVPPPETGREALEAQLRALTDNDPIPYELMARLTHSESGFNPGALSRSGARGILQFMPQTQLEMLYLHKDKLPPDFAAIAGNVERYRKNQAQWEQDTQNVRPVYGYRVRAGADEETVYATANNPAVAFILGREYVRTVARSLQENFPDRLSRLLNAIEAKYSDETMKGYSDRVAAMHDHLNRPLTYTDIKAGYVFGPWGGSEFLVAYADPAKHNHRALDYADATTVAGNPALFYADPQTKKTPRSVKWLYEHFHEKMGNDPLPDNLERVAESRMAGAQPVLSQ